MLRNFDNLGRIVIPIEMRRELGIEPFEEVEIEKVENKIIISNPKGMRSKSEIEKLYEDIRKLEHRTDYDKGFEDALCMVLNRE